MCTHICKVCWEVKRVNLCWEHHVDDWRLSLAQEKRPRHARICRDIFLKLLQLYLALRLLAKTTRLKVTMFIWRIVKHVSAHLTESVHIWGPAIKGILPYAFLPIQGFPFPWQGAAFTFRLFISLALNLQSRAEQPSLHFCLSLLWGKTFNAVLQVTKHILENYWG